jgi:hypothetical protein
MERRDDGAATESIVRHDNAAVSVCETHATLGPTSLSALHEFGETQSEVRPGDSGGSQRSSDAGIVDPSRRGG